MLTYKDVEININDNMYVKTNGLTTYIGRELRLVNGQNEWGIYPYSKNYIKRKEKIRLENSIKMLKFIWH